ncbi:MAG: hypothetical protein SNJ84_09190, partial [Verrucomicrobiia bacterium]
QRVLAAGYCPDDDYLARIRTIMNRHRLHELDNILESGPETPFQIALREGQNAVIRTASKDPS